MKKEIPEESLGYIDMGHAYGYTNIQKIKEELNIFDILEESKNRLQSLGYIIGFDFEFNFSITSYINIVGHMKHSNIDDDELNDL